MGLHVADVARRSNGYPLEGNGGGRSAEELLSRRLEDFVFPEDVELIRSRTSILEAGGSLEPVVLRFKRLDGGSGMVKLDSHSVEFEGTPANRVFIRVMTEPMLAEQALRESEERYRQLVDASPDGVAVSQDGRMMLANPAYLRLMGATTLEQIQSRRGVRRW